MEQKKKGKNVKPKTHKEFNFTPLPKYYSASRELRNQAEKQRRDRLNYYVSELSSIVPFVERAQKKVDKTSVLRLAASYIRMHQILKTDSESDGNDFSLSLLNSASSRTLLNKINHCSLLKLCPESIFFEMEDWYSGLVSIGGFLLIVTNNGKIVYVSDAIEDTFGYTQTDVLGQSFYSMINQDDVKLVENQLNAQDTNRCSFYCRMLEKSVSRNDPGRYEIIHVVGQIKPLPQTTTNVTTTGPRKRSSSECLEMDASEDSCDSSTGSEVSLNRRGTHMLVAFVQVVRDKPITEITRVESMKDEYITKHHVDGNISYVDHRISFITGLMPDEVRGSSAFMYMHHDDILWSLLAQKQMFSSNQGRGIVTYRLKCKDSSFVFLRSRGFLEVNKDTGKIDTFVCINTVISDSEAEAELKEQRRALLPSIDKPSDELIQSIIEEIPPELSSLISHNCLQRMLRSIEESLVDSGGGPSCSSSSCSNEAKKPKIIELPDDVEDSSSSKSTKENNPKRLSFDGPSTSGCTRNRNKIRSEPLNSLSAKVKCDIQVNSPVEMGDEINFISENRFSPSLSSVAMPLSVEGADELVLDEYPISLNNELFTPETSAQFLNAIPLESNNEVEDSFDSIFNNQLLADGACENDFNISLSEIPEESNLTGESLASTSSYCPDYPQITLSPGGPEGFSDAELSSLTSETEHRGSRLT